MGLTEDLHAAVTDPPAPEFDLEELVQRGRARRTTSRAVVGLAACVAVGLVIGGTYAAAALRPTAGRTLPVEATRSAAASSTAVGSTKTRKASKPTESTRPGPTGPATEDRLTAALAGLPKSMHAPTDSGVQFAGTASGVAGTPDYFRVSWKYDGIWFYVDIFDVPIPTGNACAPRNRGQLGCQRTIDSHGTTYVTTDGTAHAKASVITVDSFRPDHTHVEISENAQNHRILPLTDKAALIAASRIAGFTLHP